VKYANDFVLSAKEVTVSATGYARLTDTGKTCGMEMRFSRQPTNPPTSGLTMKATTTD